ncbi:hypothetical protein GCM10010912_00270 [Paenibacillus albidus]|uniref:Uncharacterized protein n=1 Tax=Paenibacillus albidus TaxID=2041023 RepID=A0A917BW39_9BACL|nr:hypothetical protein [Paenibacillus albidus]GGF59056.1 hypothetical protein GCM10010912_00270 [Paenibacillus albidus]
MGTAYLGHLKTVVRHSLAANKADTVELHVFSGVMRKKGQLADRWCFDAAFVRMNEYDTT